MAPPVGARLVMTTLTPPIFLIEGLDVAVFDSVQKAETFFEPIDVKQALTLAYDSEGRLLRFGVKQPEGLWARLLSPAERTVLQEAEGQPTHAGELREKLVAFLRQSGMDETWLSQASLPDVVAKVVERESPK